MATDTVSRNNSDTKANVSNPFFIHHSDHPAMIVAWIINSIDLDIADNQLSIAAYYTKMKSLWDELSSYNDSISCTCGAQNERNKLMQFLMGL
ncbi:hypothetical protein ACFX10_035364 [Malus domestica]